MNYSTCTDEELVAVSRGGDSAATDFLMERYKGLVRNRAREFHMAGGETEDLIQEGMLGLFKAVRDYDASKGASFRTFANLCISRQLYTAVEASNRQKHLALNNAVSYDESAVRPGESGDGSVIRGGSPEGGKVMSAEDVLGSGEASSSEDNPENRYISEESGKILEETILEVLSPFEQEVLRQYLEGKSYTEIAENLGRDPKSTDNALQRIRTKVRKLLSDKEAGR